MRRLPALATGLALLAGACSSQPSGQPAGTGSDGGAGPDAVSSSTAPGGGTPAARLAGVLRSFDACAEVEDYVRSEALARVGPYGLQGSYQWATTQVFREDEMLMADGAAASEPAPATTVPTYSTTNTQEAGIDEPDIIKTDGERIVTVSYGTLHVFTIEDGVAEEAGSVEVGSGYDDQIMMQGDRVLVISSSGGYGPAVPEDQQQEQTEGGPSTWSDSVALTEVDISDPSDPTVVTSQLVEGSFVAARMAEGTVRVVTTAQPVGPALVQPMTPAGEQTALAANRAVIESSTAEDWLPELVTLDGDGDVVSSGSLLGCSSVARPEEFAGLGTVTVLSVDMAQPLGDLAPVSVMADAQTVYASADHLFVATADAPVAVPWEEWDETASEPAPDPAYSTSIHSFDISAPGPAAYVASGDVRGHLLGQFSLSEEAGVLRVATTDGAPWDNGAGESESFVTTMTESDGTLVQLGQVGGMGRGEQIESVRFLGDVGYVVTFEQTDPLYTVDLSDPADPRVAGELKILGYSAYLHPVGDGLLLGIGQDATEGGQVLGAQVSLFDVSDLSDPTRVATYDLGEGWSEVESDHHAFSWWAPTSLALVPIQDYSGFYGAVGLRVDGSGIELVDRIAADDSYDAIRRTVVIGDFVFALSDAQLLQFDLDDLDPVAELPLA